MVNYKIIGSHDPKEVFGSDENVFLILKSMNIAKTTFNKLGAELDPPLVWNSDDADTPAVKVFLEALAVRITSELKKDKKWNPDEKFEEDMRVLLKTYMEGDKK